MAGRVRGIVKKIYQKPVLSRREKLSSVTAIAVASVKSGEV